MKKVKKGQAGYLTFKKKAQILRTVIYFALCILIFALGYWQTGSKENLLTVVAVVGILPSSKALVDVIVRIPYHSIKPEIAEEITQKSNYLTVIYDLIITSTEKIMPVSCIVISGNKIFGYTDNKKVDVNLVASNIKKMLASHDYEVSVKILNEYKPFLSRVEGLNNIQEIEQSNTKKDEKNMALLIQQISL